MTPVVLKMETIQQKAQYQISNMVLARKNRGKGTGTASNAYKAHIILLLVLKILSGNKILMSIKGSNSVKILQKMTGNNPKLDLVNVDVHTKFGQILSICSQDIERKRNFGKQ